MKKISLFLVALLLLASVAGAGGIKGITAYKTADGRIWETHEEAKRHQLRKTIWEFVDRVAPAHPGSSCGNYGVKEFILEHPDELSKFLEATF